MLLCYIIFPNFFPSIENILDRPVHSLFVKALKSYHSLNDIVPKIVNHRHEMRNTRMQLPLYRLNRMKYHFVGIGISLFNA